jgi:hypothetical protein
LISTSWVPKCKQEYLIPNLTPTWPNLLSQGSGIFIFRITITDAHASLGLSGVFLEGNPIQHHGIIGGIRIHSLEKQLVKDVEEVYVQSRRRA